MLVRVHSRLRHWRRRLSRAEWFARWFGSSRSTSGEPNNAPGLLLIQIDGLSRREMERAVARRRMPWLRRLLRRNGYQTHDFYSGLPSSTPAVQGELHYGIRNAVPSFSFLDPETGSISVMMQPGPAKKIEAELAAQAEGLLTGGSSWSNIYTGGASQSESHFCAASIGLGDMWRTGKLRNILLFAFLHVGSFLRLLALLPVELVLALGDAIRGVIKRDQPVMRELVMVFARLLVSVGARELVTLGAKIDLARGLPIIHVNFLGYDEQSHRRGPSSAFAHWTLMGIDRAIRILHRAARRSARRHYEVWIFSDHGQTRATPFYRHVPGGLDGLLKRHLQDNGSTDAPPYRHRASPASWLGGPFHGRRTARAAADARLTGFERDVFATAAMGPVGNVYLARPPGPAELRDLARALVADGVPGILIRRDDGRADWFTAQGRAVLPDAADRLPQPEGLREQIARDLVALVHNPRAGNFIALGWSPGSPSFTFADENGSHAGCTPEETGAFLLLPGHVHFPARSVPLRPAELRKLALQHLGRESRQSVRVPYPPAHHAAAGGRLRVVTYNTHGCLGLDGRCSPRRIARVLERLQADVIALQEIDCGRVRSRGEDQLQLIADELGMEAQFCPSISRDNQLYGHGLLSRYSMDTVRANRLPGDGFEPRTALLVRLEFPSRAIHVLTTHLGLGRDERHRQIDALLGPDWLGDLDRSGPVMLCGDLNFTAGFPGYRAVARRLHDVQAHCPGHVGQSTFPSIMPLRCLDHIFVSPHFAVTAVAVPADEFTRAASDHLPVVADLSLCSVGSASVDGTAPPIALGRDRPQPARANG